MDWILAISELISSVGFPAACAVGLAWFAWFMVNKMDKQNVANMTAVQARCKEREDILYAEVKENREVNSKAIETIARCAEKLDTIQKDISDIKSDIVYIKALEEH